MTCELVYVGQIIELEDIPNADFIVSATVECGPGGKWRGIVRKSEFSIGDLCNVFLPDSLIPEQESMSFMKSSNWRVKMRRFKGAPSEVLIMPNNVFGDTCVIGRDITKENGVRRYIKPVPANLQGIAIGDFPSFIPKTDEPNYQRVPELIEKLTGRPYYITEKCDGSSTTAFRYKGNFGLCSRNLELERNLDNGYWKVALKYELEEKLPEGIALQWETCGPGIQSNPMGIKEINGFLFSGYNIHRQCYLTFAELWQLSIDLGFPMAKVLEQGDSFDPMCLQSVSRGFYDNGLPREGVVIRSQDLIDSTPLSFKVINLDYEK